MVVSLVGAMFAPGHIVMANWTPEGIVGRMFRVIGKHVPPSPLMPSPVKWGDEATVRERPREGIVQLKLTKRMYPFPPSEVVEFYRSYYSPVNRAFAALDAAGQAALRHDLEQLWTTHNRSANGVTEHESEYLEGVAIRA